MPESFGARLRQQRERRNVGLMEIAEQTKIKVSLLDALERDDVSYWPTGIFRRAFIRSYAQTIGLDANAVLREFLELYPDPIDAASAIGLPPAAYPDAERDSDGALAQFRALVGSTWGSLTQLRRRAAHKPAAVQSRATVEWRGQTSLPTEAPTQPSPASGGGLQRDLCVSRATLDSRTRDVPQRNADRCVQHADTTPAASAVADVTESYPAAGDAEVSTDGNGSVPLSGADREADPVTGDGSESHPVGAARLEPDLTAVANLCTELARLGTLSEVPPLLKEAARMLDAVGLIIWCWEPGAGVLRAALSHGYPDTVLTRLPAIPPEADNATAAAFRSGRMCVVTAGGRTSGALAAPLIASVGCLGVLAVELLRGSEQAASVRVVVTIIAAQLAALIALQQTAETAKRKLA
jgi:transcriptional regulator with XRE-family HTH domain